MPPPRESEPTPLPAVVPADSTPAALPPVIATPPAATPVASTPPAAASDPAIPRGLQAALVAAGLLLLGLTYAAARPASGRADIPFLIGQFLGGLVVWPLIVIGLLSLGRRLRTPRVRATAILVVWGLAILSQLGAINARQARARLQRPPAVPSPAPVAPFRSATLGGPAAPLVPPPAPANADELSGSRPPVAAIDFSPGSDARLIKLIEGAQAERYREVVASYNAACAQSSVTAALALERVRFIERFAFAEDGAIEEAGADHAAAVEFLRTRFPNAAGTVLHRLAGLFGAEFDRAAAGYDAAVRAWPPTDAARFHLLRAQRSVDPVQVRRSARLSFEADTTPAAALLLLRQLTLRPPTEEVTRLLHHPVFAEAKVWEKAQLMEHLFTAGDGARATALFEELKASAPHLVRNMQTARRLADAGQVALARALLAELPDNAWNRSGRNQELFRFELEHGNAGQALAAYRTLRAPGWTEDPLWRERAALFAQHPSAAWNVDDVVGLLLLTLLLLALLLLPAPLLLPVHYWSVLRERRGIVPTGRPARWGLREAWIVLGVLAVAEMLALWWFQRDVVRSWFNQAAGPPAAPDLGGSELVLQQAVLWGVGVLVLAASLWRVGSARVLGRGEWSVGRVIGLALAGFLLLRIFLVAYVTVWPGAVEDDVASFSANTRQLCLALNDLFGPFGMIAAVAGLVPVLEELLFRGVLLEAVAKHIPFGWANVAQSLLFASVHENLRLFPFFVAFGLVCGVLARRSGGLLAPILLHACNNLLFALVLLRAAT